MKKAEFGRLNDGRAIDAYVLRNSKGGVAKVIAYGATLTELWMPDRNGQHGDVVLGFDELSAYLGNHPWFGATVGRVANRIAAGRFSLRGKQYLLDINDPPNSLHGGRQGLSRIVWRGDEIPSENGAAVKFSCESPEGDAGFPGALSVSLTYTLTDDNELKLSYRAQADKPTPVNLTHHSYFNLGETQDVLDEVLYLNADQYTPVDADLIPTGEIAPVKGTPLDFTQSTRIGARIAQTTGNPKGYDHNFVLRGEPGRLKIAARVLDPKCGRQMEVWTTEPGIQFYAGNFLDGGLTGKRGVQYRQYAGFCLEAQHFPDAVNQPQFPSIILEPGSVYQQETVYKFTAT